MVDGLLLMTILEYLHLGFITLSVKTLKKQASEKATQAKAHGNAPANLPGTPPPSIPGNTAALAWF